MSEKLNRRANVGSATIPVNTATSEVITTDGYAFGGYILPATFDGTTMTFTVSTEYGGTYVALEDSDGNAITHVVEASKAYIFPPELFAFPYAKLVAGSNQTTTDTVISFSVKG